MSYPRVPTAYTPDIARRHAQAINHLLEQTDWADLINAADDTAAAAAGVEIGQLYRTASAIKVRVA